MGGRLRAYGADVLRQASLAAGKSRGGGRDICPCSTGHRFLGPAESGVPREHDGLVAVADGKLAEHVADVIANAFFRQSQRFGDFLVVEPLRYGLEHRGLTTRLLTPGQAVAARP